MSRRSSNSEGRSVLPEEDEPARTISAAYADLPEISVVVPSLNQGKFLKEALASIFRQNYPKLEVVVMDGGSTDGSIDIIRSHAEKLTYWQSRPDAGQAAAINEGLERCTGNLLAWLNSDDLYWKDAFWTVARAYAEFPGFGLYVGNGLRYSERDDRYSPFCKRHVAFNREALLLGLDYVLQPSVFFLREAWQAVGGVNEGLRYCMDWDLLIRIADRYPAVLVNEFLSASREYAETKTSTGGLGRAVEIAEMVRGHTGSVTPGVVYYWLETLLAAAGDLKLPQLDYDLYEGMKVVFAEFSRKYGNPDGFPEQWDPQDRVYLPIPGRGYAAEISSQPDLPRISIVTPTLNQAAFLERCLGSVLNQGYPSLETLVFDGGSTDGSLDILKRYDGRLTFWATEPDRGPAHAINKGLAKAEGEILGWLNSDDMLAENALREVGEAFARDPELDLVFANALYIDENDQLMLADHGVHRTGLYYGEMQPKELVPAYWRYVHAVPQPTVFFRRRLLGTCGDLNEEYKFIFDFELFWRFLWKARIEKIEKTLAFYRIHGAGKTSSWKSFEVELYRFSRPWWPSITKREFRGTLRDFLGSYMRRNFSWLRRGGAGYWSAALLAGACAVTGMGNPEKLHAWILGLRELRNRFLPRRAPEPLPPGEGRPSWESQLPSLEEPGSPEVPKRRSPKYDTVFCSYVWPRHPGYSGGEIRDFHLLKYLLEFSRVEFFALYPNPEDDRKDVLAPCLERIHVPGGTGETQTGARRPLGSRLVNRLRGMNCPVVGPRFHYDASIRFPEIFAHTRAGLQSALERKPAFLFVSPQSNPVAFALNHNALETRLVMASYDVEAVRIRRLADSEQGMRKTAMKLEARRALRFERENLSRYDGIIAVSELDRDHFVNAYGFAPERVLVIDNGVDTRYFGFQPRMEDGTPEFVFVGSFTYLPNLQAAWRLLKRVMPLVWEKEPLARVWIVGQAPGPALQAAADDERVIVTGRVEDVRPFLAKATAGCVPLVSGSGTKYKILEALAAGMPVVCTPLAIEGLELQHNRHIMVGDTDQELADALLTLHRKREWARELAMQGRRWVEERYSWESILPRLEGWLDRLAAMPRRSGSRVE